ncbi:MAG: epoxide hydrolase, partial [Mycobacterium sp.]|nr:epoxide hydrolase [Mycobacterium sp.]
MYRCATGAVGRNSSLPGTPGLADHEQVDSGKRGESAFDATPPDIDQSVLDDLRRRVQDFRPVVTASAGGWDRGVDPGYLGGLVEHWGTAYDWRVHERRIAALPWVAVNHDSAPVRAIHQRSDGDAPAVLLLHGWPDSVLRFERLLPLLTEVNVVAPALPGFPFALPVREGGLSSVRMAEFVAEAMAALGYTRYVVSAGDVGCDVAEALAARHPEAVSALHLTDVSQYHFLVDPPSDLSAAEQDYVRYGHQWQSAEGGYMHLQSTKPQTVAAALGDSPVGLAAWIVEKLFGWTDCAGDLETVFTPDEVLTWVTAYWVTGAIGTSFTPYAESGAKPWGRLNIPTAFTVFPHDLVNAPREFADRFFAVADWRELSGGGHFG